MPPNLGGFFMVRSYYPSECHADYFDFERIEALKPAIEACGISTLSQSPMLEIGRAVQQECRDRSRMPSSAWKKNSDPAPNVKVATSSKQSLSVGRTMVVGLPIKFTHMIQSTNSS